MQEENIIREARQEDLQKVLELYLFLHEKSVLEQTDHLAEAWNQILKDENHYLIVNEVEGKIVSSCVSVIIPNLTRNVRPYALIENVVTDKDYRGRGLASECPEYARQAAEQCSCCKIMLLIGSSQKEVLEFYKKAGCSSSDKTAFIQWLNI